MCGIVGSLIWETPDSPEVVERMNLVLSHRGPDNGMVVNRCPALLGHRRLSVIDLSQGAAQPMCDVEGKVWIVFNGEIYNFRHIRSELERLGVAFRTGSDTEVLLQSYKIWKEDCLARLNGMFTFAIWDENSQSMLLARDRMGEKPLYYQKVNGNGIIFGSELKALRQHPRVSRNLNASAVSQYLSMNYTLTDECILEGVKKLPAANYLYIRKGKVSDPVLYWNLAEHYRNKSEFVSDIEAEEALNDLLTDSVNLRLESDVPLGAFLSGGLDSSSIVAAMNRLRNRGNNKTFSVGFHEASYNELPQARFVADYLEVDHKQSIVDVNMAKDLPKIVAAMDEPFADTSFIPMYYLAQFARKHVTVCLSGDGADELFGGYETYIADRLYHWGKFLPREWGNRVALCFNSFFRADHSKVNWKYKTGQFLAGQNLGWVDAHLSWRGIFSENEKRGVLLPGRREEALGNDVLKTVRGYAEEVKGCHYLDQAMYMDIKTWLVDDILYKVDRSTMAHSLESRAPFLDHRLVEFAARLPVDLKIRGWEKKYILKKSQLRYLPSKVIFAPKKGFNAPTSQWFNGDLQPLAMQAIRSKKMMEWFDMETINKLWAEHKILKRDHGNKLFGLTCLALWLEQ